MFVSDTKAGEITCKSPAKINLYLHVLRKRPDGYHDLATRMQKIDLCDTISLALREEPGVDLDCTDPELPMGEENLAVRAALKLLDYQRKRRQIGVSIRLEKKIPSSAGLGGGSSDAGTVLKMLNRLLGQPCSTEELVQIAAEIGADVPFFATELTSVAATGIGEKMEPVPDLAEYLIILVNPGISVSTRWAFQNLTLTKKDKKFKLESFLDSCRDGFSLDQMHNDLEVPVISRYPVIGEIRQALLEAGAEKAMMSGSGSTVFGLFGDIKQDDRDRLIERLSLVYGERVYVTRACAGA